MITQGTSIFGTKTFFKTSATFENTIQETKIKQIGNLSLRNKEKFKSFPIKIAMALSAL